MNDVIKQIKKSNLILPIRKYCKESNIKKILVALSGGADSIATAYVLKEAGVELIALHCNFHLRGEESNRDMDFVDQFCRCHEIPLEIKEFDVKAFIASHKGTSVEMACRDLRHDWFRKRLRETDFDRIATGHNADDNIETFFINLLRGCGSRGLKGMVRDNGFLFRPLLYLHKPQILEYLKENSLDYVVDSTNLESDYRRNLLRNKILPLFKNEWKGFDSALDTTLKNLNAENQIVESQIAQNLPSHGAPLSKDRILNFAAPLLLIKRYIDPLQPFSTTPSEILSAIKAEKPHIRRWNLRKGIVYLKNGELFVEMIHSEGCT